MTDQWISPTDHDGCEWEDCANVLDSSAATSANIKAWCKSWTPWLIVGFPPTTAHKVKVVYHGTRSTTDFQLDIYKNGAWVNLFSGNALAFPDTLTFMPGTVEKVRFRVYYRQCTAGWVIVRVSWVALWGAPSEPASTISGWLNTIGTFFHDLAADIQVAWLVGQYLAAPFEWIGNLFYGGVPVFQAFEDTLNEALSVLREGINWVRIEELFREYFPTLAALADDPVEWFLVQLTLAFDLEPWHTQSLEFLAKWILEEYFLTLYQIWLNPEDWFAVLLEERFPVLYYLVVDPKGKILYLIGQAFDLTPYEAQSAEFIVKALFERYFPELYLLWRDPGSWVTDHGQPLIDAILEALGDVVGVTWDWLLDQFEERFDTFKDRLYSLAEHTLRFFWEGVW